MPLFGLPLLQCQPTPRADRNEMFGADGQIIVGPAVNASFGGGAGGESVVAISAVAMLDVDCVSDDVHTRL